MKRILLVDDEVLIRKLARNTLLGQDFVIMEAANGEDALEMAHRHKPDLILLDLRMPGMGGFEICRLLKSDPETSNTIVIMLSAGTSATERDLAFQAGAHDFITKPFSPIVLLDSIRTALREEALPLDTRTFHPPRGAEEQIDRSGRPDLFQLEREQLLMYSQDLGRIYQDELDKGRQLREALNRLQQLEKTKDVFVSLVSHELRTPLSIIKGYLNLLGEVVQPASNSEIDEFLGAMKNATLQLESLIQELLDFSQLEGGGGQPGSNEINLKQLLSSLVEEMAPSFEVRNLRFILDWKQDIPPYHGDYSMLKEAFFHLIKNAINFTAPGGSLTVTGIESSGGVEISFVDTGIGIPRDKLETIFTPFFQVADPLTREVEGIGLGLSIVRHIVENHAGKVMVESTEGIGTTFTVLLPRRSHQESTQRHSPTVPGGQEAPPDLELDVDQRQLMVYAQDISALYEQEKQRAGMLEENVREMEQNYLQTIAALAQTIDVKDAYVKGHTDRVSHYANLIAARLDPELMKEKDFQYSLLLHDIGKLGVAEDLLHKVDRLSDDEWARIRSHTELGEKILAPIRILRPALASVRSHHERWDGNGYPDGLTGAEIPLPARIIAVADAFDAMTTNRPYRAALSLAEARQELMRNAGTQFDPQVVGAFLEGWEEIVQFWKMRENDPALVNEQPSPPADNRPLENAREE